jgi:hypothetical protein
MADETETPGDLPTKNNIVRRPCDVAPTLSLRSAGGDEGIS